MKKIILTLCILLFCSPIFADDIQPVLNNNKIYYSLNTKTFSTDENDGIVLKKSISSGTGNYSIYSFNNSEIMLGSDYEFLYNGRLIACHNSDLKIFEVIYNGNNFQEKELTEAQIKEIFPDAEILLISQFVDNKANVRKPAFEKKDFLLLNNTDKNLHKYKFYPQSVKFSPVGGLFKASTIGKITYSHFGEDKYIIYVKNNFRK